MISMKQLANIIKFECIHQIIYKSNIVNPSLKRRFQCTISHWLMAWYVSTLKSLCNAVVLLSISLQLEEQGYYGFISLICHHNKCALLIPFISLSRIQLSLHLVKKVKKQQMMMTYRAGQSLISKLPWWHYIYYYSNHCLSCGILHWLRIILFRKYTYDKFLFQKQYYRPILMLFLIQLLTIFKKERRLYIQLYFFNLLSEERPISGLLRDVDDINSQIQTT